MMRKDAELQPRCGRGFRGLREFRGLRGCRGLTLVELMMAVSVLSLIGLAVTGMLTAVTRGTQDGTDLRKATIDHTRLGARLGASLREAYSVVMADASNLILWRQDTNDDGDADLDELEMIRWEQDTSTLVAYRVDPLTVPTDLSDDLAIDPTGQLFGTMDSVLVDALTGGDPEAVVWGDGVTGLTVDTHENQLSQVGLVSYRIALAVGDLSETAIGTVWLRNHTE